MLTGVNLDDQKREQKDPQSLCLLSSRWTVLRCTGSTCPPWACPVWLWNCLDCFPSFPIPQSPLLLPWAGTHQQSMHTGLASDLLHMYSELRHYYIRFSRRLKRISCFRVMLHKLVLQTKVFHNNKILMGFKSVGISCFTALPLSCLANIVCFTIWRFVATLHWARILGSFFWLYLLISYLFVIFW